MSRRNFVLALLAIGGVLLPVSAVATAGAEGSGSPSVAAAALLDVSPSPSPTAPPTPSPSPEPEVTPAPAPTPRPTPAPTPEPTPTPVPTPRPAIVPSFSDGDRPLPLPGPRAPSAPPANVVSPPIEAFTLNAARIARAKRARETGLGVARRGEASATLRVTRATDVYLSIHRSGQAEELGAVRFSVTAGDVPLRITRRFGRRTVKPGLYDVKASTSSLVSGTQQLRVRVRVLR